ncbi:hypothetical protein [Novosphingobium clariflavum]|uniref:Uncharacterized protein n=1 Tax=Novosphingobium clariflavum TaxID=2029884 RepID=A0ABV6S4H9_9SPHN|nr:hypothetical protein [Novosphingobium clariflavum]
MVDQVLSACAQPAAACLPVEPPTWQAGGRGGAEGDELIHREETRLADQALTDSLSEQGAFRKPAARSAGM